VADEKATVFPEVPDSIRETLLEVRVAEHAWLAEYATLTNKGLPIDTPLFAYAGPDGTTIDVATGVAYPTKAERVRSNPRVGLLIGTNVDQPSVLVSAFGSVRDADIQANTERYVREFCRFFPMPAPWPEFRKAIWYWSRLWVQCMPVRILAWPRGLGSGARPLTWAAPDGTTGLPSDPAPALPASGRADWKAADWRERADVVVGETAPPVVTAVDGDGFPLPFAGTSANRTDEGFVIEFASALPWPVAGKACLTFGHRSTFVGTLTPDGSPTRARLAVTRMLGELPIAADEDFWAPGEQTRTTLTQRLERELERRRQPIPRVPEQSPVPGK
jgi:hypothetical protein